MEKLYSMCDKNIDELDQLKTRLDDISNFIKYSKHMYDKNLNEMDELRYYIENSVEYYNEKWATSCNDKRESYDKLWYKISKYRAIATWITYIESMYHLHHTKDIYMDDVQYVDDLLEYIKEKLNRYEGKDKNKSKENMLRKILLWLEYAKKIYESTDQVKTFINSSK